MAGEHVGCDHMKFWSLNTWSLNTWSVNTLKLVDSANNRVFGMGRGTSDVRILTINSVEYRFKSAVLAKRESEVINLVQSGQLLGQSLLQFLREESRPGLALNFIRDPVSRFWLAMEDNDLLAASDSLSQVNPDDSNRCWAALAERALLVGNLKLAETAHYRARNYQSLQLLYTITGQWSKLEKLSRVLEVQGNFSAVYSINLLLGKVRERSDLLERAGQHSLAKLTLQLHGLNTQNPEVTPPTSSCFSELGNERGCIPQFFSAPPPIDNSAENWPSVDSDQLSNARSPLSRDLKTEVYRDEMKSALNSLSRDKRT